MNMKYILGFLAGVALILVCAFVFKDGLPVSADTTATGSVATSTDNVTWGNGLAASANIKVDKTLKYGPGILNNVMITGTTTATMKFLDATTTDVNLRTGNTATSAIRVLADITTGVEQPSFPINANFSTGLLVEFSINPIASSTITYQ